MSKSLILSVHQLVDFLLRKGDIDNRVFNRSSMSEGSRVHANYQSIQDEATYLSEYPLKDTFFVDEVEVTIQGRADGIIKGRERYIIDEIKSTVIDLKEFRDSQIEWHLGQAKVYAYMFAKEQHQNEIGVRLTYIKQGKEKEKFIEDYVFLQSELEEFTLSLVDEYLNFYNLIFRKIEERRVSIQDLAFPFKKYRQGQRELTKLVYGVATKGGKLFVEAPTGIGKTMSTLFPYIKSMGNDDDAKIFYLTAKSSGKEAAMNAVNILKDKGLKLNNILITAKEKICFSKGQACNPDECPFAKAYYDKIQNVLKLALLNYTTFDYQTIVSIAKEEGVCPFEFQLDLSLFSDVIICDYNYLFDPTAYLRRYFDTDAMHYLALIDEAHNMVDRSREMYSARLSHQTFLDAKKSSRGIKEKKIKNAFKKMAKFYEQYLHLEVGNHQLEEPSDTDLKYLHNAYDNIQEANKEDHKSVTKETTKLLLEINSFLKICELFSERYIYYVSVSDNDIVATLYCLDSSRFIASICQSIKATTFFSATLSPIDYYIQMLGGSPNSDPYLILPSPFPRENLLFMIAPRVSIRYKDRESSYDEVANYVKSFVSSKIGNYFVYVPSYEYLDRLTSMLDLNDDIEIFVQGKEMSEQDKTDFLLNFQENPDHTKVGFLVIGGAFSEGIDLVNDRLIGAIIVGVGIPKINFESDQIMEYYKKNDLPGYDFAYLNPGMNKVMQAVGRVIRSETDRGAILLIDARYTYKNYRSLYKSEWSNYKVVFSPKEVGMEVSNFFKK